MERTIFLFSIFFALTISATGQIVDIPDPNFKAALLANDPVIDTNGDGEIQVEEARAIDYLYVQNENITDLSGISEFSNLTSLLCGNNQLASLDVSALTNLTYLDCGSNQLTTLDISALTNLTNLGCGNNQLTSLDVAALTNLTDLDCYNNQFTALAVSALTNLTDLSCGVN